MEKEELEKYQELTSFQKSIVDGLKNIGYKWKYFHTWELIGFGTIEVKKIDNFEKLIRKIHQDGKDEKRFEICRAIGLQT